MLFLILCGMAFCINLALFRASNGEINMFFVGPANTTLIVFKDIAARFGLVCRDRAVYSLRELRRVADFQRRAAALKRLRTYAA